MSTGHELLSRLSTLQIEVLSIDELPFGDGSIEVSLRIPADDVDRGALSLIFALSVLSYSEARPREVSAMHYDPGDQWTIHDLVEHPRFQRGHLVLETDYVRGRMMKTTVDIAPDGMVVLQVANRAGSA